MSDAADRPDGVPDDAVPTPPMTLWVTPGGVVYSSNGWPLTNNAAHHGIPVPRPPRTDPWGLGLTEDVVRGWAGYAKAQSTPTRYFAAACRAVVAEWDNEDTHA